MKKIMIAMCFILSTKCAFTQGIDFEKKMSWEQIVEKAKTERKYIFVDCFASWCAPCREVDQTVFRQSDVGAFFTKNFVSVKIQFDSTANMDEYTAYMLQTAKLFENTYDVKAFPTYLFFDREGKLVAKEVGVIKPAAAFMDKVTSILDPANQYYTLRDQYWAGERNNDLVRKLVPEAVRLNDWKTAYSAHNLYVKLMDPSLKKEELRTMYGSISKTTDSGFHILQSNAKKIDEIVGEVGRAESIVKVILERDIDDKFLKDRSKRPNWKAIKAYAKEKAPLVANQVILQMQTYYAKSIKEYNRFARLRLAYYDKYAATFDHNETFFMNNELMEIFLVCTDRKLLKEAAKWSKESIYIVPGEESATNMDTYANILYKAGETKDALYWQERALTIVTRSKRPIPTLIHEIESNLNKMRSGVPTWSNTENQ